MNNDVEEVLMQMKLFVGHVKGFKLVNCNHDHS